MYEILISIYFTNILFTIFFVFFTDLMKNRLDANNIRGEHKREARIKRVTKHLSKYIADLHKRPKNRRRRVQNNAQEMQNEHQEQEMEIDNNLQEA